MRIGKRVEARRQPRVVASHAIARSSFRAAGLFGLVAVCWTCWVLWQGGSWWGPLHSFLAGTVLLAIAGATQMFTITWAAAPAPPATCAHTQRWALITGAALTLAGMGWSIAWMTISGAVLVVVGLALLAYSLLSAIQNSLLRRFDLSSRFYLLAIAAGLLGVVLGGIMGAGSAGPALLDIRLVHSHLNLVGLVGLTIVGTLPTILPTFAHHRAVSRNEARVAWWLAMAAIIAIALGLVWGEPAVGVGTLLAGLSLVLLLGGVLIRLGRRGLEGGLPYFQVAVGSVWLGAWTFMDGTGLLTTGRAGPFSDWTGAVVIAGIGQILLGSLAYLLPVLAGPPPRLGRNLERTHARPWLPLALANAGAVSLLVGYPGPAVVAVAAWGADFVLRLVTMEWPSRNEGGGQKDDDDGDDTTGDPDGAGTSG